MNRMGLAIALTVAVAVGTVFAIRPQFDLDIAALFYNPQVPWGVFDAKPWVMHARDLARLIVTLMAAPAVLAILGKLVWPRRRMLIEGRAALFLIAALAIGPGLVANIVLKDHWGRSRPIDVTEFGGADRFTPWWDARGSCLGNCSFIAGEPSGAFWTLAPAALAPPQWQLLAYGGAVVFGALIGLVRIAGGGHFFTDVVFAGVIMYLLVWVLHGLIYRWRHTRIGEDAIERVLARIGEAIRGGLAAVGRRLGAGTRKPY